MVSKQESAIIALVIIAIIGGLAFMIGGTGTFSTVGGCSVEPLMVAGKQVETLSEFNSLAGTDITEEQAEEAGIQIRSDGLYSEVCPDKAEVNT